MCVKLAMIDVVVLHSNHGSLEWTNEIVQKEVAEINVTCQPIIYQSHFDASNIV